MKRYIISFCVLLTFPSFGQEVEVMSARELASFETPEPDYKIQYGPSDLQFGELRIPEGDGPHPLLMFIHGGCWLSQFDIMHTRKLMDGFKKSGIATWSIEYRKVGDDGGGWPGTFEDVAKAGEILREIALDHNLDLENFIIGGHSAGGHLALWFSARPDEFKETGLTPKGILALAPAPDLEYLHGQQVCGHVIDKLMGGSPDEVPQHYLKGSGRHNIPTKTPQHIILGAYDKSWAPVGGRYIELAQKKGAKLNVIEAPLSGHFEMINPEGPTWEIVLKSAKTLLNIPE